MARLQKALQIFQKIGDAKQEGWCLSRLADVYLSVGDLQGAEGSAQAELEVAERSRSPSAMASGYWHLGHIRFCEGLWEKAAAAVQEAIGLFRQAEDRRDESRAVYSLGRILLAQGDRAAALERCQEALDRVDVEASSQGAMSLASILHAAEEASPDRESFLALCARWRQANPRLAESLLAQWYLEPAEAGDAALGQAPAHDDRFSGALAADWTWQDPLDDCWFRVEQGLEIHAANRRGLWHINLSAPRVLRPASGDLAVQAVCSRVTAETGADVPACGGLLMWRDLENYVWLNVGTGGAREFTFGGCVANADVVIGRGRLPSNAPSDEPGGDPLPALLSGKVHLRLERLGDRVRALCSTDEIAWFSVGEATMPLGDPLQVGPYADGNIDRLVYPAAYPNGTAIRFGSFQLWAGQARARA